MSINKSDNGIADRTIIYYMVGADLEENSLSATETISEFAKYYLKSQCIKKHWMMLKINK